MVWDGVGRKEPGHIFENRRVSLENKKRAKCLC